MLVSLAATLNLKTEKANAHSDYINSVAFSPDGTKIVSGSDDKTIMSIEELHDTHATGRRDARAGRGPGLAAAGVQPAPRCLLRPPATPRGRPANALVPRAAPSSHSR